MLSRIAAVVWIALLTFGASEAVAAQPPVGLGTSGSFGVLAGSGVTNTGASVINGDVGVSPATSIVGFPPGTVNGTVHAADGVAAQAQFDLTTAYNDAAGRTPPLAVPSGELGGLTLVGGVYRSGSALGLTGTLTLDAQGDPTTVFIFQAGSSLTTASASRVSLINGAQPCNVYWQIGSSATLGTTTIFAGNILALTSISMNNGVRLQGRALARNGAVTLINDTITAAQCATGGDDGTGGTGGDGGPGGTAGDGAAILTTSPRSVARKISRVGITRCVHRSFDAVVTGLFIRRVVFSLGGRVIDRDSSAPYRARIAPAGGVYTVRARVTFTDGTAAKTLRFRYRACAEAAAAPQTPQGPGGFTG